MGLQGPIESNVLYWGDYLAMGIVYTVAVFLIGYVYGTWRQMGDD